MVKKLILYNVDLSPPVRTVKIVAKLLGLEFEIRDIDLMKGENFRGEFAKLNPEHIVPTLVDPDNNLVIWDSHAICAYLIDKYGKDNKLYPKDLKLRAKVNQRLFFDAASLFVRFRDINVPIFFKGISEVPEEKIEPIYSAYDILEALLSSDPFLVGQNPTIADISVATSVLALEVYVPADKDKYPKIFAWLKRVRETIPYFEEINGAATNRLHQILLNSLERNKKMKSKL